MHTPPFLPGDRVRVNTHGTNTSSAPRDQGILYVKSCELGIGNDGDRKHHWRIAIVGKLGYKPHGRPHTGHYNAMFFDLVCRDPAQSASR